MGGVGPQVLKKQGVIGSFAPPPPSHSSGCVTDHKGGSNKCSGPGSQPRKVSQAGRRRALRLRGLRADPPALAAGPTAVPARAYPIILATPTPTSSDPLPCVGAPTASGVRTALVCRRTVLPTIPADLPPAWKPSTSCLAGRVPVDPPSRWRPWNLDREVGGWVRTPRAKAALHPTGANPTDAPPPPHGTRNHHWSRHYRSQVLPGVRGV